MRLKEWAAQQGIHYQTAWKWFRDGKLPVPALQTPSGTILVQSVADATPQDDGGLGLYARVSSHDQRADLDRQVSRLTQWAAAASASARVVRVEAEVASGMTGRRPKLRRLLADPAVRTVVVTHRDRLARMNAELVEAALSAHGRRLVVLDDGEVTDDLVRDMVEVLTSFCARVYGRRSARNRALKAVRCAERDVGPAGLAGAARGDGDRGDRVVG
jgi:putative resolvase